MYIAVLFIIAGLPISFSRKCMQLDIIVLSKFSQCHKDYYHMFSFLWILYFMKIDEIVYVYVMKIVANCVGETNRRGLTKEATSLNYITCVHGMSLSV